MEPTTDRESLVSRDGHVHGKNPPWRHSIERTGLPEREAQEAVPSRSRTRQGYRLHRRGLFVRATEVRTVPMHSDSWTVRRGTPQRGSRKKLTALCRARYDAVECADNQPEAEERAEVPSQDFYPVDGAPFHPMRHVTNLLTSMSHGGKLRA